MTIDTRLAELAPDPTSSAERVARLRAGVLARAVEPQDAPRPRAARPAGRRWLAGGVLATACTAALVVGPTLLPDAEPFAANALTPLARAAEGTEVPPLSGGRVLHRITEYRQTDSTTGKVVTMQWDEWTLGDGTFYRRTTVDGKAGPNEYWDLRSSSDFAPADIAALPTEPAKLLEAVEASPQAALNGGGDDRSAAEGLIGAIIYRGYAPTKVWAAAIEAYGGFDDVKVRVDEARSLTFVTEIVKGGPLTLRFDSDTGQLRGYESHTTQDGGRTEIMTVRLSRVEAGVPDAVRESAQSSGI